MYQKKTCFFLSKEHLNNEIDFKDVLLMPIDEFYNHSTYGQLNFVNSYGYIKKTFLEKLKQYHYKEFLGEALYLGDVVMWKDKNEIIQHAAYYIEDGLYFNKHG